MKRVKSACLCQTLQFTSKEGTVKQVWKEVARYKRGLERDRVPHKILEETQCEDGTVIVKLIRQYQTSPVGEYMA